MRVWQPAVSEWRLWRAIIVATTLLLAASMTPAAPGPRPPAIVADALTGLAIAGHDPVAFFIDGAPRVGLPDHEAAAFGVTWRFVNEGNRAAFVARPDAYRPRFGGYDALAVARGVPRPGHASRFAVHGGALYLFATDENRAAFLADPSRATAAANLRWPEVERGIGR